MASESPTLAPPVHPLAKVHGQLAAAAPAEAGIRLSLPSRSGIWQVLAFSGRADAVSERLARLARQQDGIDIRGGAPDESWVIAEAGALSAATLADTLGGGAAVIDQSAGRVRFAIEGPKARELLAKGTAVDLHPDAFAIGRSAQTLFGHIAIHLTRTGENGFEFLVARSFAESLWDEIAAMGAEFGLPAA